MHVRLIIIDFALRSFHRHIAMIQLQKLRFTRKSFKYLHSKN